MGEKIVIDIDEKWGITDRANFKPTPVSEVLPDAFDPESEDCPVMAWKYWDGTNFEYIVLDPDFGDGTEADVLTSAKILCAVAAPGKASKFAFDFSGHWDVLVWERGE